MARLFLGALTFCFLVTLGVGHDYNHGHGHVYDANFEIHGRVYCDPCRVNFETRLSYPIDGVTVQLQCTDIENKTVTLTTHTKTCNNGMYKIEVPGDHQNDECVVSLHKNPSHHCNDIMHGLDKDIISLTVCEGVAGIIRYANDLGYMTKDINPQCPLVIHELGIKPDI